MISSIWFLNSYSWLIVTVASLWLWRYWSGRIFFIGCYLGIFTVVCIVLLHYISPFQCICWEFFILCSIAFVCMLMSGLRLSDLNKETTYLLTWRRKLSSVWRCKCSLAILYFMPVGLPHWLDRCLVCMGLHILKGLVRYFHTSGHGVLLLLCRSACTLSKFNVFPNTSIAVTSNNAVHSQTCVWPLAPQWINQWRVTTATDSTVVRAYTVNYSLYRKRAVAGAAHMRAKNGRSVVEFLLILRPKTSYWCTQISTANNANKRVHFFVYADIFAINVGRFAL